MSSERLPMPEDSDSEGSEATANSTNESVDESLGENIEVAKILDHKFHLPKDLCEDPEIFKELFSPDTWNQLSKEERSSLSELLPEFPENNEEERDETIQQLFENTLTRFNQTPLDTFHSNLQDGNYRPDIAHYRTSILKAEEREQRIRECERISLLAEQLVGSREKLLRSAYRCPPGSLPNLPHSSASVPRLSSSSATMRANRRYFQEISKLSEELGLSISDDEVVPEAMQVQLTKKQIKQFTELGGQNQGVDTRIISTMSTRERNWDHLISPAISDSRYKTMLQNYRKRKTIEPDHPEMEVEDIKLKDIFSRTQLTINPKKLINAKKFCMDPNRIKQEVPYSIVNRVPSSNLSSSSNQSMMGKNVGKMPSKATTNRSVQQSETDEEDWIKANIIKVEPKGESAFVRSGPKVDKLAMKQTKIKTIYPQHPGNMTVNRKRSNFENAQVRAGKKIIIDAGGVVKSSFVNKNNAMVQNKRIVVNSRPTVAMDPNDLIEDCDGDEIDNSPESRHEVQTCFLSLIRDIFCSTRDHRMKLEELRNRINIWLSNPIASMNDWFTHANDWGVLLISAVHFLSGEFQDQPDDFVPYLEFKSQLNIYQWIGAGRDSDARMAPLCQYWLGRRNEMGIKATNPMKHKVLSKSCASPEKNEENHLQQAVSPPNARCRTDWKVQPASDEEILGFQSQERQRYENPHLPFTYRQHGYESVVGPLRGIYSQSPAVTKARDHNTLIADRPNFVTILALVRDAAARLPNGEGTRWDICELLKSSQYIASGTSDAVIQTIVSGALDRMHTEHDPCIKYDTKRKVWIYVHRNRSEGEFERLHLQQQENNRQKKPVFKRTKLDPTQQLLTISSSMRVIPNSTIRTYQTKLMPSTSNVSKPTQALTSFDNRQRIQSQASPPPLKISPKRYVKVIGNEKSLEVIDVEESLDAHTTPIVKSADPKTRISLKNVSQMSPIRIVTSSPATGSFLQSSPSISGTQSFVINSSRSQSPKVGAFVGGKKIGGKPVIIGQNQAPPLVSQSSPNTSQSYLIPVSMNASGAKVVKAGTEPPALMMQGKPGQVQQKNIMKVVQAGQKTVINPQQKIILTASSALQAQKGGKVISTMTLPKSQSPVTMLSQQKQILTNVIVQQQKAKGQNQILMAGGNQQKMPGLTISSSGANSTSPQMIQIQQSSVDGKFTTVSTANLTPQQRQTIFQSLKQLKPGTTQSTMILKPQIVKTGSNDVPAPPLVSVGGSVGKVLKTGTTTVTQQPQVFVSMGQKTVPKTTFKTFNAQSGLIQISGAPGSPLAQYAVVSKGKSIVSLNNQTKMITTTASNPSQNLVSSTGNVILSTNQSQQQLSPQQNAQTTTQNQPIKIVQGGSITAQQLLGAKLINVQTLGNKGIKTTGGIKMINSQNYIANIGGKPLIIAGKANLSGSNTTTGGQGIVLQASNSPNGTIILNSQGQQLKVQGNILTQGNVNMLNQPMTSQPQTVMLGNQIVKVQSLNQLQQKIGSQTNATSANANQEGQRPIILGSTIKVLKNVMKTNVQPPQQQAPRVVLAAPGSQAGQFSQQIILPANFQGLKTLQGLKVIPMGQQGSTDRVFATTRLITNNNATVTNNNSNANKLNTSGSQEEAIE